MSEFLSLLEEYSEKDRFNYSIDNISRELYQVAKQIKKGIYSRVNSSTSNNSQAEDFMNKKILISNEVITTLLSPEESTLFNISSPSSSVESNLLCSSNNEERQQIINSKLFSSGSILQDVLTTAREEYCIIRIWQKGQIESGIVI